MSYYYISAKNKNGEYEWFEVQPEVYIYIRQLECYVRYPEESKLKKAYPERFPKNIFREDNNI